MNNRRAPDPFFKWDAVGLLSYCLLSNLVNSAERRKALATTVNTWHTVSCADAVRQRNERKGVTISTLLVRLTGGRRKSVWR
ncbi:MULTISPECIES: hypothetical protein [Paenibacillus]|uniref:hypothetical protein n=1 Tax=Paenibacillus TaxID=44249 RepID=UPI0015B803DA|nr:hypothetical protein [Paenibacillus odorifer]